MCVFFSSLLYLYLFTSYEWFFYSTSVIFINWFVMVLKFVITCSRRNFVFEFRLCVFESFPCFSVVSPYFVLNRLESFLHLFYLFISVVSFLPGKPSSGFLLFGTTFSQSLSLLSWTFHSFSYTFVKTKVRSTSLVGLTSIFWT